MPTQPQDRKPRKGAPFAFTGKDGKRHTLPLASKGAEKVEGRLLRNAALGDDGGDLALQFALLEACGATPAAINALYDLPAAKMVTLLQEWMSHGDGDGATVPQSSGSST